MTPYEIIKKKRDGRTLNRREIETFIQGYVTGEIPDYQMSALLMAIFLNGMDATETSVLTSTYIESGVTMDFSFIDGPVIDKHSTGGVGDKVSLILAPIVAAFDIYVPMISGRGLGHTGGTLDKLESIPGFRTDFSRSEFKDMVAKNGFAIVSQSSDLTPADGKIYSLRDVTATVDCIPLIVASIMSKKLAEGIDGLVLDVKTGNGAFMESVGDAKELGENMVEVGNDHGCETRAVISDMNQPLGKAVGNALEVEESIDFLRNEHQEPDLKKVVYTLASHMLLLADIFDDFDQAYQNVSRTVEKGKALEQFRNFVDAQGGNPEVCDNLALLDEADYTLEVRADKSGFIESMNTLQIGLLGVDMGAGRRSMDEKIDPSVGFHFYKKIGDRVNEGELIANIFSSEPNEEFANRLAEYISISDEDVPEPEIVKSTIVP